VGVAGSNPVGLFTGIAAFFGVLLTTAFGLAGIAGVNPVFLILEVLLVLAWRNAGWIGLDRFVLPKLGTPWEPGPLFRRGRDAPQDVTASPPSTTAP
jgi:thiosulfate dehydrogenase (quinone) large subunit